MVAKQFSVVSSSGVHTKDGQNLSVTWVYYSFKECPSWHQAIVEATATHTEEEKEEE